MQLHRASTNLSLLILSFCGMPPAYAQGPQPPNAPPGVSRVATAGYRRNERDETLTLWRQAIPPISAIGILSYFKRFPEQNSFPNTAFLLVASNAKDSTNRIVWATYIFSDRQIRPQETWMADLASPVSVNAAHVVLAKSISNHVEFQAYEVPLDRNLGTFPIELNPSAYEGWPPGANPAAVYRTELAGHDISGVAAIHAVTDGTGVIVNCKRDLASTPTVDFRFDRGAKTWKQVEPAVGPGAKPDR